MGFGEAYESKRQRMQALRILYTLPLRSQFIAYNILSVDPTEEAYQGIQVQQKLPIVTLDTLLDSTNPPRLQETMRYLKETAQGLEFLIQNGLRLTDISLRNIAIHTTTNQALLFDFDGLRPQDAIMEGYVASAEWWPPERRPRNTEESDTLNQFMYYTPSEDDITKPRGPVDVSEMIFELGKSLHLALAHYPNPPADMVRFAARMIDTDPNNRPPFEEVTAVLQDPFQDSPQEDSRTDRLAA
jgi:serine/threonine protein kinase